MSIQKKVKRNTDEKAAQAFIGGSDVVDLPKETPKTNRKPVALRFDENLLNRIDAAAKRKGISRNAWISFHCAEALDNE